MKESNLNPTISIFQSLLLKPNDEVDSGGDFVDIFGSSYSSKKKPTELEHILSARGASMMIRRDVFWELDGFDEKFFASFEDVDMGWRAWLKGFKAAVVPTSIVYHLGDQTVQKLNSIISFHGVKNSLVLRLTNFEILFVVRSIVALFFVVLMKKLFGVSILKGLHRGQELPSFRTIVSGGIWIMKNYRYILNKRRLINSRRIYSTKDLIRMKVITEN